MHALLVGLMLVATLLPRWAFADDVVRVWTLGDYQSALLHELLERTRPEYGAYEVVPFTEKVSLARATDLLIDGRLLNLITQGIGQPRLEREAIPVQYPIDKGLLGYRVGFIDAGNQEKLSGVKNLDDMRKLRVGQGRGWGDVRIYEFNGIPVETSPDTPSLFPMLVHGRFDLFPRGINEIAPEFTKYSRDYPSLAIEKHVLLHYPFYDAFYVSPAAPHLAKRLSAGFELIVADGSFDALFAKYFGKIVADLHLRNRVVVDMENPDLPPWVPLDRKELWFDPAQLP
ncbi:MAG: hypothetical protein JWQ89_3004 [Devosia sp.]|uniref:hypothetical protein n=1 Tax=Devosia sp. TaxID=1871048 RepID=UPI002605D1D0|nr:hypothetical protein [Devosia sp.]MDB5541277.1 hypothetical protein [Devosia sp.]